MKTMTPVILFVAVAELAANAAMQEDVQTSVLRDDSLALVLSGGGAKGAYEVGVWQALAEAGVTNRIDAISGTSVGAINAALFATRPEAAETLWLECLPDIFSVSTNRIASILEEVGSRTLELIKPKRSIGDRLRVIVTNTIDFANYGWDVLLSDVVHAGILDSERLGGMLSTNLQDNWSPTVPAVYATALKKSVLDCETRSWRLNEEPFERKVLMLRASAAVPEAFDNVSIDGFTYIDGGWDLVGGSNAPISPILDHHPEVKTIIVVYLNGRIGGPWRGIDFRTDSPLLAQERYCVRRATKKKKVRLVEIIPSENIDGLLYVGGFFDSSPETARRLIDLGRKDAREALKALVSANDDRTKTVRKKRKAVPSTSDPSIRKNRKTRQP